MTAARNSKSTVGRDGQKYRSIFESRVANELRRQGVGYRYEPFTLNYTSKYTPDFEVTRATDGKKFLFESKGYFPPEDRAKMLKVAKSNPGIQERLVFILQSPKAKATQTMTQAQWCTKHGFLWIGVGGLEEFLR